MSPRLAILGWMMLLALTLAVAVVWSGCSKNVPDCPVPTSAWSPGYCFAGVRKNKEILFCTKSLSLCQYAQTRAVAFAGPLELDALSVCREADVTATLKK